MRLSTTALLALVAATGLTAASADGTSTTRPTLADLAAPVVAAEEAAAAAAASARTATLDVYGEANEQEAFLAPDGKAKEGTNIAREIRKERMNRRAAGSVHHPPLPASAAAARAPQPAPPPTAPSLSPACTTGHRPGGPIAYTVSQLAGVNCARAAAGIDDDAAAAVGTVAAPRAGGGRRGSPGFSSQPPVVEAPSTSTPVVAEPNQQASTSLPAFGSGREPVTEPLSAPLHLGGGGGGGGGSGLPAAAADPGPGAVSAPPQSASNPVTDILNALGNASGGEGLPTAGPLGDAARALASSPPGQALSALDSLTKGIQAAVSQNPLQLAAGALAQIGKWNAGVVPAGAAAAATGPGVFAVAREGVDTGPAVHPLGGGVAAGTTALARPAVADLGHRVAAAMGVAAPAPAPAPGPVKEAAGAQAAAPAPAPAP